VSVKTRVETSHERPKSGVTARDDEIVIRGVVARKAKVVGQRRAKDVRSIVDQSHAASQPI
jgi:hypothetical protein